MSRLAQKVIIYAALIAGGTYLALVAYVYLKQGSMLYFPSKEISTTPAVLGLPFEEVFFRAKDGVQIAAWFIPAPPVRERGVVLFSHGNAGNISDRLDSIRIFHGLGLSVLIYDYRGYGRSGGSPTEEGTYRDAEAAWEYLVTYRRVKPEKVILFGRSLGSAVATETALRKKAGALIIESGFTSVPDLGSRFFPHLPVRLISRFHYDTAAKVGRITIPKLVIHSPEDEIVPFDHGRTIYKRAAEPRAFLQIRGGHNEGFLISGSDYITGLDRFLSQVMRSGNP